MTTTLRPVEALRRDPDGSLGRRFHVCVNSRPVGSVTLGTEARRGAGVGRIRNLWIDEEERRRGRGCVALLATEEVLRGWGCTRVEAVVPASAMVALRLTGALGYTERNRYLRKPLGAEAAPPLPPGSAVRPMRDDEYGVWAAASITQYAQSLTDRGVAEEQARAMARHDHDTVLSDGPATPGAYVGVLTHREEPVGTVWLALRSPVLGEPCAYVMEVEVADGHRGRGHGRSLMLLAEDVAREAGDTAMGLSVYTDNTVARGLYESLGYRALSYHFYKHLH
jgi:ribosomal protein S18 acetylase RimI-like enzyme